MCKLKKNSLVVIFLIVAVVVFNFMPFNVFASTEYGSTQTVALNSAVPTGWVILSYNFNNNTEVIENLNGAPYGATVTMQNYGSISYFGLFSMSSTH